jgi:signal transduction histidine kinase
MKEILSKIFRVRYFLSALLLGTILILIFNPNYLYEKREYFKTEYNIIEAADQFTLLPNNPDYDAIYVNDYDNRTIVNYHQLETGELKKQIEIGQKYLNSNLYTDPKDKSVYVILNYGADYFIYELCNNENPLSVKHHKIFHYDIYDSLQDTIITLNNIKFYEYEIDNNIKEFCKIEECKDGYRLFFTQDIFDSSNEKYYNSIVRKINDKLQVELTNYDLYELVQFFRRNSFFYKKYFVPLDYTHKSFLESIIIGMIDANNDGNKELIIKIVGTRWINDILLCYDIFNKKLLWKKEFTQGITDFSFLDIDNDGEEEILCSSYSPSMEMPIDKFKKQTIGTTSHCTFYILSNNGDIKNINKKPAIVSHKYRFSQYKYLPLLEQNKILLGLDSDNNLDKKLILFDIKENKIDTLDIVYQNLIRLYKENGNIIAFNSLNNELKKIIISQDLNIKKIIKRRTTKEFESYPLTHCKIDGNTYLIFYYPLTIADNKLNFLYQVPSNINVGFPIWKENDMYFIEKRGSESCFSKLHFERNRTLNPYVIIILLAEILLIISYLLFFQIIRIPLNTGTSSYFVLYTIFGKLYYWKLYGGLRKIYKLPKNVALSKEIPEKIFRDIAEEIKIVFERSFVLFKYKVYEILSHDEFQIIQRISHDLKNQVLLAKLTMEQFEKESTELWNKDKSNRFFNNLNSSFKEISNAATILSNFSHISKLYREKIDLKEYIQLLLSKYINHPFHDKIKVESRNTISVLSLDKNLFEIAFKNIINNALEAITEKDYIKIEISDTNESIIIEVKNPSAYSPEDCEKFYKIGFSTKEAGSGLGIPISKTIIEKHDGTLSINCENNEFTVTVILPKINKM